MIIIVITNNESVSRQQKQPRQLQEKRTSPAANARAVSASHDNGYDG